MFASSQSISFVIIFKDGHYFMTIIHAKYKIHKFTQTTSWLDSHLNSSWWDCTTLHKGLVFLLFQNNFSMTANWGKFLESSNEALKKSLKVSPNLLKTKIQEYQYQSNHNIHPTLVTKSETILFSYLSSSHFSHLISRGILHFNFPVSRGTLHSTCPTSRGLYILVVPLVKGLFTFKFPC